MSLAWGLQLWGGRGGWEKGPEKQAAAHCLLFGISVPVGEGPPMAEDHNGGQNSFIHLWYSEWEIIML